MSKFTNSLLFTVLAATAAISQTAPPAADSRMHKPLVITKSLGSAHATEKDAAPAPAPEATDSAKRKDGAVIAADFPKNAQAKSSLDGASKDAAKPATATETKPRDAATGQASGKREAATGKATGKAAPREAPSGMASGK